MRDPDIVVIGAGLAGLSVAYHAAPYARVLVLDQGAGLGPEASQQNVGMVRTLADDPVDRALAVRSAQWLADPPPDWPEAPPARDHGAILGLVHDPHHLDDAVAHLRARAVAVGDRPPAGVPGWAEPRRWPASWWVPSAQIADPAVLLRGFAATVEAHGGSVQTHSAVRGFVGGERIAGVRTDDGTVACERVVIAAGAWSGVLGRAAGVQRPLVPLRRSVWRTAPHPLADPGAPWVWIDDLGLYVRPDGDRFLVCGCDEQPEPGPVPFGSTGPADPRMAELTRRRLGEVVPALADLAFEEGWSGLRTFAPDRRPLLGPDPDRPGLWWAAGLGGSGVTISVAAGEAVASWLRDQPTPWLPRRPVDPGRRHLRRFPVRPQGDWASPTFVDVA